MSADNDFYKHDDNDPCYDRKGHYVEHYFEQENNRLMHGLIIALGVIIGFCIIVF